jgi:ketosteroid isomerase-like protein
MDGTGRAVQNVGMPSTADDRHAIQDVIVTYAASVDDRNFDAYRSCFADDVELEGFGPEPVHGLDTWMEFVVDALASYRATQHMLGVPKIEIDGDTASMRTDVQASHFPSDPDGKTFTLWATYETKLGRHAAGWKIQHHRLVSRAVKMS